MAEPLAVADQLGIREVIARYAWALDTGDVEGFVACFCRDGVAGLGYVRNAGTLGGRSGPAPLRDLLPRLAVLRRAPASCDQHRDRSVRRRRARPVLCCGGVAAGRRTAPAERDGLLRRPFPPRRRGMAPGRAHHSRLVRPDPRALRRPDGRARGSPEAPGAGRGGVRAGESTSERRSGRASVDHQALPGDVIGEFAAEHRHDRPHVVAIAEPPGGDPPFARELGHFLLVGRALGLRPFGELLLDEGAVVHAGQQVVDDHVVLCHDLGNGHRVVRQGSPGAAGKDADLAGIFGRHRRDIDDPAPFALDHSVEDAPHELDRGQQGNGDGFLPLLAGDRAIVRRHRRRGAGSHQDVRIGAGGENPLAPFGAAVVGADGRDPGTGFLGDFPAGPHEAVLGPGGDEHVHPFAGQGQSRASPHPRAAAVDDRPASPDPKIHVLSNPALIRRGPRPGRRPNWSVGDQAA